MDVHPLLSFAVDNGATEVLIQVGLPPTFRFPDGLRPAHLEPLTAEIMEANLRELLGNKGLSRLYRDRHVEFMWHLSPGIVFRTTVFSERTSWAVSFRLMPTEVLPPEKLLLPKELRKIAGDDGSGLILGAAAPGHGRSTTLLSLVNAVNLQRAAHVLTLERRLKVLLPSQQSFLFQREVGSDPMAVAGALKAACVQDPDVLMITHLEPGMLPDALDLAGRGRLVLAGFDAPSVLDVFRILLPSQDNTDALRASLALSLRAVMAQRLVPRADAPGRVLASEILPIRIEEARMLRAGDLKGLSSVLASHAEEGVLSMDRCIQILLKRGLVDRDVARRHMNDPKLLES